MNSPRNVRRIDLFEAVKYDIRLHGSRFISVEFGLAGAGALALTAVEFAHARDGPLHWVSGLWFLSFALNCLAVVVLGVQVRRTGTATVYSDRQLHLYVVQLIIMLLIPLAIVAAVLVQWRRGDLRHDRP